MEYLKKISRKYRWLGGIAAILSFMWQIGIYAEHGWQLLRHWW